MGQVAFDTLQASEELETAGISREQARAISLVVRKSHEVADVATKADIAEVKRDISDVRKEIADVRKDIANRFDKLGLQMTVRVGGMLIAAVGGSVNFLCKWLHRLTGDSFSIHQHELAHSRFPVSEWHGPFGGNIMQRQIEQFKYRVICWKYPPGFRYLAQ
ncbi:hypothetical protein SODG_001643 [Sodalis praecaptivus]